MAKHVKHAPQHRLVVAHARHTIHSSTCELNIFLPLTFPLHNINQENTSPTAAEKSTLEPQQLINNRGQPCESLHIVSHRLEVEKKQKYRFFSVCFAQQKNLHNAASINTGTHRRLTVSCARCSRGYCLGSSGGGVQGVAAVDVGSSTRQMPH